LSVQGKLPEAIEGARETAGIVQCANDQHQIMVALHTWATDNDGKLPPGSGYSGLTTQPGRGVRGSGDFFDVLVPEYIQPREVWYCPGGVLFWDTGWGTGTRPAAFNPLWNFQDYSPGHAYLTQTVYANLQAKGGYTDIPRKLSDPGDWVLVNERSLFDIQFDGYWMGHHPGLAANFGIGDQVIGRNGIGAPGGVNTGTLDGSVRWTPQEACMLGWRGRGTMRRLTSLKSASESCEPGMVRRFSKIGAATATTAASMRTNAAAKRRFFRTLVIMGRALPLSVWMGFARFRFSIGRIEARWQVFASHGLAFLECGDSSPLFEGFGGVDAIQTYRRSRAPFRNRS
jgi:hypothetical protein